jgi:hypothetical protein
MRRLGLGLAVSVLMSSAPANAWQAFVFDDSDLTNVRRPHYCFLAPCSASRPRLHRSKMRAPKPRPK